MKKLIAVFLLVAMCTMSMTSVFATNLQLVEKSQKSITLQEYYDLFEAEKANPCNTISEIIQLSDTEFTFKFYGERLLGKPSKPKTDQRYFEVYSPFVGEHLHYEAVINGFLYEGNLRRGKIAETINGEDRYWYIGWLDGYELNTGISPFSTNNWISKREDRNIFLFY